MTTFSDWLAHELEKRNMIPAELARLSDKDPGMISRLLKGERSASPETLLDIARALRILPEDVFRAAVGLPQSDDDLSPKKRELMQLAEQADEATVEMALAILEAAWERKKRETPSAGRKRDV